eukprot:superscaffoldBa00002685_g14991
MSVPMVWANKWIGEELKFSVTLGGKEVLQLSAPLLQSRHFFRDLVYGAACVLNQVSIIDAWLVPLWSVCFLVPAAPFLRFSPAFPSFSTCLHLTHLAKKMKELSPVRQS